MTNAVIADERHRQFVFGEIDKIIELKSKNPAAADKIIRRIADTVPKFVPRKAAQGEGVPRENLEMAGDWECSAKVVGSWMKLRFTLRAKDAHTFSGEWWVQGTGLLGLLKLKRAPIEGTWMEVNDTDQDLLLGLVLDGLKAGEPLKLEIPIQRRLGDGFVGTDRNGIVYQSKIVQVRREGL